jgi:hypothetical protein
MLPCKWHKEPYPPRKYEVLTEYTVASRISDEETVLIKNQLDTTLEGFVGQAYNYDDHKITEDWMVGFKEGSMEASEDDIVNTQIASLLELMTAKVQDRVCNETGVLIKDPLGLGPYVKEAPVWGIDCYTRKMVELAIEDRAPPGTYNELLISKFIERRLLPSINAQLPENAHNMTFSLEYIRNLPNAKEREKCYCSYVLESITELGYDSFKIHPKGTGIICTSQSGIPPHVFIAQYLGELYPPYRWCERLDVIQQTQEVFGLKPTLPDFYNILLERPRGDPNGYCLFYVDASEKANMASSCSHSCNSNLTSAVVARNGKLTIAMTTTRHVNIGEELSMDYFSITNSEVEWRAAVCLCGMSSCRGSFLQYATLDDLQQILNKSCGPLFRYSYLLKACSNLPLKAYQTDILEKHGMHSAVFGDNPPLWMKKYAAESLSFIEHERKALPCSLMRPKGNVASPYTCSQADMDARMIMEQRLQSLVCCFSMVQRVLQNQPENLRDALPVRYVADVEAIKRIRSYLSNIPSLLEKYAMNDKAVVTAKGNKSVKSATSNESDTFMMDDNNLKKATRKERVTIAVKEINISLDNFASSLAGVKVCCLTIRKIMLTIVDLATPTARLGLLADLLVLWAFTTNFSYSQEFKSIESEPVVVVARELGNNIPRKILNQEEKVRRSSLRKSSSSSSSLSSLPMEVTSVDCVKEENDVKVEIENQNESTLLDEKLEMKPETISLPKEKIDSLLSPSEPVRSGTKTYVESFAFWQLMGWFNAGTEIKIEAPDVLGCIQLPEPSSCFGVSEIQYTAKLRKKFIDHLHHERDSNLPWSSDIKGCFSSLRVDSSLPPMNGSPMMDVLLGRVDAVNLMINELVGESNKNSQEDNHDFENKQYDSILPPEQPSSWVQCESLGCRKWRRVPWHIDIEALPDEWFCNMNTWDESTASCDIAMDNYDADKETSFNYESKHENIGSMEIGSLKDVFCNVNKIYYVAKIIKIKEPKNGNGKKQIRFHFMKWASAFDEWIDEDSDRIHDHNLFTDPSDVDPKTQEIWQGFKGNHVPKKGSKDIRKKEEDEKENSSSNKKRKSNNNERKKAIPKLKINNNKKIANNNNNAQTNTNIKRSLEEADSCSNELLTSFDMKRNKSEEFVQ